MDWWAFHIQETVLLQRKKASDIKRVGHNLRAFRTKLFINHYSKFMSQIEFLEHTIKVLNDRLRKAENNVARNVIRLGIKNRLAQIEMLKAEPKRIRKKADVRVSMIGGTPLD